MRFIFKNLIIGEIISSDGGMVFRELNPTGLNSVDLSTLGLPAGEYSITVTATSIGLTESNESNSVTYVAE